MTPEQLKAAGFTDKEIAEYKPAPTFDITGPEAESYFNEAQVLANAGLRNERFQNTLQRNKP